MAGSMKGRENRLCQIFSQSSSRLCGSTSVKVKTFLTPSFLRVPLDEMYVASPGVLKFPPLPTHDLPRIPTSYELLVGTSKEHFPTVFFDLPELTDFGCEERALEAIDRDAISSLAVGCNHRLGPDILKPVPPLHIEVRITPHNNNSQQRSCDVSHRSTRRIPNTSSRFFRRMTIAS